MKAANVLRFRPRVNSLSKSITDVLRGAPVLAVSSGAILGAALAIAPPSRIAAQQPQPQQTLEEITVTGSRIQRQDFTANSPITTIDEASFQNTSTIGVEKVLNELPQFVPALSQFTTTDVQQTANNTIGARTLSLRGLGANRNLVLIDGKRAMPINPTMVIDTNSIPRSAIARVEVITGGASAVYGADAVGGVVNFILKDDFEGASVDVRYGDTEHGGNEEVSFSALLGANVADDRGNVMLGLERSTQSKVLQQDRDWRVEDMRNPATPATAFGWGSDTWVASDGTNSFIGPNALNSLGVAIGLQQVDDFPDQNVVNAMFNNGQNGSVNCAIGNATDLFAPPGTPPAPYVYTGGVCPQAPGAEYLGVPNTARFLLNRPSGTLYTGLLNNQGGSRSDLYQGPYNGDQYGNFQGLPFRVVQPDGQIKENNFWQWASGPLERLSAFGKGHFDISDKVRVTGSASYTRTEAETSLGLTADLISFWGAAVPYGMDAYNGNPAAGIPATMIDTNGDFIPDATHPAYLPGGRFGVNCDAQPTAAEPWHDGLPGCTQTEAWPVTPQVWQLMNARKNPNQDIWISRPPDYIRNAIGSSRAGETTSTISQFSVGLEGDLGDSGNHSWDATISTGRTDSMAIQSGSARLSTYRAMMASPNFGRNSIFDPNAFIAGFAESTPTCTSGLPVIKDFAISNDCVLMLTPDLKNQTNLTQNVFEANLTGDLVEMKAGPLGYAIGTSYRENSFEYTPDNLSLNQNFVDPIAGLFPNEGSAGKFDVAELYGELLVPIISDGPAGIDHFNLELGARMSDWSMDEVGTLASYKTMIDWGFTPKYRMRAGFNRAHRAPNLGELFLTRTQIFGGDISTRGDVCSPRNTAAPWSANTGAFGTTPIAGSTAAQAAQTEAICRTLMGVGGATQYYGNAATQPTVGGVGIQNQLGNENLAEEQADTFTVGLVADVADDWTVSVDYYSIEIEDMIALEGSDAIYQRCVSQEFNPTGNSNAEACQLIFRDPTNGNPSNIDRAYNNEGRVQVEGVDFQVNWNKMLDAGGLTLQLVANYNISSETQDRPDLPAQEWAGTNGCALQIQCQGYDYRLFTTVGYFRGSWGFQVRHQYWPSILSGSCVTAPTSTGCAYGLPAGFGPPGVDTDYQLIALSGNYDFADKYSLRFGIENLFDEEPPMAGGDPTALPFATPDTHIGGGLGGGSGATYDPLGRRFFVSMTMNF
jgi:outer membrane cobalamin receptor